MLLLLNQAGALIRGDSRRGGRAGARYNCAGCNRREEGHLPFGVDFFLGSVRVHVVELVLLVAHSGGRASHVQVVRVPDGRADAHLVGESLHRSSCVGRRGLLPRSVSSGHCSGRPSLELRLEERLVDGVDRVTLVVAEVAGVELRCSLVELLGKQGLVLLRLLLTELRRLTGRRRLLAR